MSKCAGNHLILNLFFLTGSVFLCAPQVYIFWLFLGLRNLCLLCKVVLKEGLEGEFRQTGPGVRSIFIILHQDYMHRVDCRAFVLRAFVVFDYLNRHISWFRIWEGALPPTILSVHVGKWNLSTPPLADAQH